MPVKSLPPAPDLAHLKYQARDLMKARAARDQQAAQRIREFHPRFENAADAEIFAARFTLADAQLAIARERGFATWARLKRRIEKPKPADNPDLPQHERIEDPIFRHAVDLLDEGAVHNLRAFLALHPKLAQQRVTLEGGNYFRNPSLLEFVAGNPIRRGKLPPNIVDVARVILDAGARNDPCALNQTLGLVCSGRVPRECGAQIPLICLLCQYGAEPDRAIYAALTHAEFDAVNALIRVGGCADFVVAAGLGRERDVRGLLALADHRDLHRALAVASQFGHTAIVRLLLEAGEDPNRYNPVGFHSHSTPLHQAVAGGHGATVRVLVEHGARLDLKDTLWQGTPAGWAEHEGRTEIREYLRLQEERGRIG